MQERADFVARFVACRLHRAQLVAAAAAAAQTAAFTSWDGDNNICVYMYIYIYIDIYICRSLLAVERHSETKAETLTVQTAWLRAWKGAPWLKAASPTVTARPHDERSVP